MCRAFYYAHPVTAECAYDNLGYWADAPPGFEEAGFGLVAALVERAGVGPDDEVLDVGCGCGASSCDLVSVWGCRRVVGIDVNEPALLAGRREAARRGVEGRVGFRVMSATALELADASFTRVVAVDCACLFASREAFFAEAYRVLRPGGVLAIADALAGATPVGLIQGALVSGLMRYWKIPRVNYYGLDGYRQRLAAAGFGKVRVETVGERVFPGATACALSDGFRSEVREASGRIEAVVSSVVFRLVGRAYRQGLVEYVLVVAKK